MNSDLILKYLTQRCTEDELRHINSWANECEDNRRWLIEIKALWEKKTIENLYDSAYLDRNFNEVLRKIDNEYSKGNLKANSNKRLFLTIGMSVAASILLFLFFFNNEHSKYPSRNIEYVVESVSSIDSIRRIVLPDESIAWLGSNSTIKYLSSFSEDERKIFLLGEAYFDIKKDVNRPFRVKTPEFTIKVLGTKFNIQSYKSSTIAATTLFSGSIVVENELNEELLVLTPGQKLKYLKENRQMQIETLHAEDMTNLFEHNNFITFNSATLGSIINRLKYTYDVAIDFSNEEEVHYATYSGSVQYQDSLEQVFNGLRNVIPFEYERQKGGGFLIHYNP